MPHVVWLHGLGDSGAGWSHLRRELRLEGVQYTFPDAPVQPVTCNGGHSMTSWMDLENIPVAPGDKNDKLGVQASAKLVHATLDSVVAAGTPSQEIVLGGFSQGGAMALYAGYTYPKPLAGVVVFSGWAPLVKPDELEFVGTVQAGANAATPAFVAHGTIDNVVVPACGEAAANALKEAGVSDVMFTTWPMAHSSHPEQMVALREWIKDKLKL